MDLLKRIVVNLAWSLSFFVALTGVMYFGYHGFLKLFNWLRDVVGLDGAVYLVMLLLATIITTISVTFTEFNPTQRKPPIR